LSRQLKKAGFPRFHIITTSYARRGDTPDGFFVHRVGCSSSVRVGWSQSSMSDLRFKERHEIERAKTAELIEWVNKNTKYQLDENGWLDAIEYIDQLTGEKSNV